MKQEYLDEVKAVLKEDYEAYIEALQQPAVRGFRVNTLKIDPDSFFSLTGWQCRPTPFAANGFYLDDDLPVSRQNAYAAALFYMQEPSASASVTWMDPKPGMKILDLCAAPGTKSQEIAMFMENKGELIACDLYEHRTGLISQLMEITGVTICRTEVNDASKDRPGWHDAFDRILIDAPCSGLGDLRHKPEIRLHLKPEDLDAIVSLQKKILNTGSQYLKDGGILVYSTCTLNKKENEKQTAGFLSAHPDFELVEEKTIFPFENGGDGFYMAKIRRNTTKEKEVC